MDLDEAADRLYGLPPGEFVAARTALQREARESGDVRLARAIGGLRRPTVSAWAVNQVARERPEELDELLGLGEDLRRAWHDQDPGALADLTRRRPAIAGRLVRRIADAAERHGHPLQSAALNEVQQTLDAATVDPDAAGQVRDGRLVHALTYSGFTPAPAPRPAVTTRQTGAAKTAKDSPEDAGERRAAERERRRAALEEAAAEAERAAAEAERDHAEWAAELEREVSDHDALTRDVHDLETRLADARRRLGMAERRLGVVRRDEGRSRDTAASARRRADEARRAREQA